MLGDIKLDGTASHYEFFSDFDSTLIAVYMTSLYPSSKMTFSVFNYL